MKGRTTFNVLLLFMAFFLTWGGKMAAQDFVFHETFAKCVGKGGNDDAWSGISGNKSLPNDALLDNAGWSFVSANAANGCASIGTSKALGSATTPALTGLEGDATLTFRAGAWAKDATSMVLSIAGGGELSETEITLLKGEFSEYTVNITGGTSATQITFAAKQKSGNRFMLDDVTITSGGGTPSKPKAQLTFDATTATATLGEAFTAPTLTTTPEGIAVTYSSSDTGVATVDASTGAVTPIKAGTTIITATFAGNDDYTEASASYELTVISNEAADGLYAAGQRLTETAQTFKVKLTDAVITYVNGNNAYIEDATGGSLIFYADHGFVPGQKINGVVTVTGELYGGSTKEFTAFDTTEATVTDGAEIPVTELTVEELAAKIDRYESCRVKISNAAVTDAFSSSSDRNATISQNGTELGLFKKDRNATIDLDVNGTYDFVGYPGTYNGAAQLNIWTATDVTPTGKQVAKLTFDATTATATLGESFTAPTLTTTPEGIAVTYSSSDTDVATVDASTGAVTPIKAGTTTITATFAGNDDYTEASASYELTVNSNEAVDGLYAAGQRLTETAQTFKVKLTGAVITYVNGKNAYIEDATGGALIYYADHGFVPGQKIDGVVTVTGELYGSTKEFTDIDASEATVTDGTEIPVTELTVEELVANVGRYESCRVKISNAVVTEAFSNRNGAISQNGTELGLFQKDRNVTIDLDVNGTYDFVGYPGTYNGAAQLNIWAATDVTPSTSTTIPITIATDEGYTTLYTDQAYTLPEGLKATSVQYAGNGSDLSMGWEYAAGDIVPAQTALLIQSLDGKAGEYTAEVASDATSAKQPNAGNCLYGTAADETPADDGQSHYYKLTYSNVDGVKTLGFYWDNETGAPFTNKGGKAYLKLPKEETAAVKGFTIGGGAVTGISGVTTDSRQADAVYTISGVRVQGDPATLPQGIYIVGGKKVLVK